MTNTETYLVNTVAELMHVSAAEISLTTPLEELGVDSFMALRYLRKIHKDKGVNIPLKSLLSYADISALAAAIDVQVAAAGKLPEESKA